MTTELTISTAARKRVTKLSLAVPRQTLADWTFDGVISALWRTRKFDTAEISKILGTVDFPECRVANRIAELRDAGAL